MVILGEDAASEVYKHLPQQEVERITREVAGLKNVTPEIVLAVLEGV